jgi:20S proteasome alpha/beta subunit
MTEGPSDAGLPQLSNMRMATSAMHELYVTLKESGFTSDEALKLISSMLSSVIEQAVSEKKPGA